MTIIKKPLKLLHVDDSAILRKLISRGLEPMADQYQLTQAGSVDEALAILEAGQKFDVILTDWLMNGKNGVDLLCALKANPTYHHLPVFFLTSEYDSSSLLSAITYGASGILRKPITAPEIHTYLEKKAAVIEQAHAPKENNFLTEARQLLGDIQNILPLKNKQDLTSSLQHVQTFKTKAKASDWPLLAEYSQRIEDTLQVALKKEMGLLTPLSDVIKTFHVFVQQCLVEIEAGRPHPALRQDIEASLKNFHTSLEAGWFAGKEPSLDSNNGTFVTNEVLNELQRHLSPEGQQVLENYLKTAKTSNSSN